MIEKYIEQRKFTEQMKRMLSHYSISYTINAEICQYGQGQKDMVDFICKCAREHLKTNAFKNFICEKLESDRKELAKPIKELLKEIMEV